MRIDEDLIPLALSGDQDAYTKLFHSLGPLIGQVAWRYFKGSSEGEDFECNAKSHILMRLDKFDGNAKFSTWATRVAINHALEMLRKGKRVRENTFHLDDVIGGEDGSSMTFASNIADERDGYARIEARWDMEKVLSLMRPQERDIMVAQIIHGWTLDDLVKAKGKSLPAVKAELQRAKQRAREIMEDLENGTIEGISEDSQEGIEHNPVVDRIVQQAPKRMVGSLRSKTCICGCGQAFIPNGPRQTYSVGHRLDQAQKTPAPRILTSLPAAVPVDMPLDERVTINMSAKAFDRLIAILPAKLKASAVERLLEGL